ncbi:phage head closure protein [Tissierella praeacuta]|uniref:phage head closure protein n=1 Tax=Tissierella praeacuta TaxID=43131 RepID=UPI0028A5DD59|nr:phage head closure protein [Tissierella praeacuta]
MRDYRRKIDFLQRKLDRNGKPLKDEYGELLEDWELFKGNIWASKDPLLGNEFFTALTADSKVEVKFNMRYIDGVTSEMRIRHGEEIYEIIGSPVNVKSLNRELLCYCRLVK